MRRHAGPVPCLSRTLTVGVSRAASHARLADPGEVLPGTSRAKRQYVAASSRRSRHGLNNRIGTSLPIERRS